MNDEQDDREKNLDRRGSRSKEGKTRRRARYLLHEPGPSPSRVLWLQPWEAAPLGQVGGGFCGEI